MRAFGLVCLVVFSLGCSDGTDPLLHRAEEARELLFDYEPPVTYLSRDEYAARAAENAAAISDADLFDYAQMYGRLGFFDVALDLRPVVAGSSSDWVGASYSPKSGAIIVVGDPVDDILIHEYVHALQDQNFDFALIDRYDTSDAFLARRAVIEGDATLAAARFVAQEEAGADLDAINWGGVFTSYRQFSYDTLVNSPYPSVFMDYPTFCYAYGLEFDAHNLTGVRLDDLNALRAPPYDWGRQDDILAVRPIDTTQDILRLGVDPFDPVVAVGLAATPAGLELIAMDDLGEWVSYLLFFTATQNVVAARALAAPWDGDRVWFFRNFDTTDYGHVWVSAWEDTAAATAVADTIWSLYGRNPTGENLDFYALANDGEPVWIEQRNERLVLIKNIDKNMMPELVTTAFAPARRVRIMRNSPSIVEWIIRQRDVPRR